jgi:hypothetical protein
MALGGVSVDPLQDSQDARRTIKYGDVRETVVRIAASTGAARPLHERFSVAPTAQIERLEPAALVSTSISRDGFTSILRWRLCRAGIRDSIITGEATEAGPACTG